MTLSKHILKNKPTVDDNSQYNVDDSIFTGIIDPLDFSSDLYTTNPTDSDNNVNIINNHPFLWMYKGLKLEINRIYIVSETDWESVDGICDVYLYDGAHETIPSDSTDLPDWETLAGSNDHRIYRAQWDWNNVDGYEPHGSDFQIWDMTVEINSFPHYPSSPSYTTDNGTHNIPENSPNSTSNYNNAYIDRDMEKWDEYVRGVDITQDSYFYLIVRMGAAYEQFDFGGNDYNPDQRDRLFYRLPISKTYFYNLILAKDGVSSITLEWGSTGTTSDYEFSMVSSIQDSYSSSGEHEPGYSLGGIQITLYAPSLLAYTHDWFPTGYEELYGGTLPQNMYSESEYWQLKPNGIFYPIDMINYGIETESDIIDFRPISTVTVSDGEFDIQSYYEESSIDVERKTSAPNTVNLSLQIADIQNQYTINYLTEDDIGDFGFIGFVTNWDLQEDDPDNLDDLADDFPTSGGNMTLLQNSRDEYYYIESEITDDGRVTITSPDLSHTYQTAGIKTIQVVVFSYLENPDEYDEIQSVRWKLLNVRVNLQLDNTYIEDFADIGGSDFVFLPWPETSVVISGISNKSKYTKSLKNVVEANLFSEDEYLDKIYANKSFVNDEYGSYIGKSDIEQVRCFIDGSYDMAKILGIQGNLENQTDSRDKNTFYPHTNDAFYDGYINSFSAETSALSIFISDNVDSVLVSKCIFELNGGESNGNTIRDSAGGGNRGILIGDYKIRKGNRQTPVVRDSVMKTSKVDIKDRAL